MRRLREWATKRPVFVLGGLVVAAGAVVAAADSPGVVEDVAHRRDAGITAFHSARGTAVSQDALAASGSGGGGDESGVPEPAAPPAAKVASAPGDDRVIRRGVIELEVRQGAFDDAFRAVSEVASAHGGFVAGSTSSTRSGDDERSSGSLTLRVPGDRFDAALRAVSAHGKVKSEQLSGTDVGGQLVDLGARLASARVQEDALRALMGRANTVGETLQVQEQLGRVRQEIEQLAAEQARLQDQVAMASIEVRLGEPGAVSTPREESSGLARSVERAFDGAVAVLGGTIVVLGYLVPLLMLGLLAWLAVRVANVFTSRRAPSASAG